MGVFGSIFLANGSVDLVDGVMHVVGSVEGEWDGAVFDRDVAMHGRKVEGNKADERHC